MLTTINYRICESLEENISPKDERLQRIHRSFLKEFDDDTTVYVCTSETLDDERFAADLALKDQCLLEGKWLVTFNSSK